MANPVTVPGDLLVPGNLRVNGSITPTLARVNILAQAELQPFVVPWTAWRVHDALHTNLPGTAATDDLALVGGTWASASPTIQSVDFGQTTTTGYARAQIALPWEYETGQSITLRFHAGMLVVADASCTLDVICFETNSEGGISADICATDVQSINSAVFADMDFVITPTSVGPGDLLDVRIVITGTDANTTDPNVTAVIGAVKLLCDVR